MRTKVTDLPVPFIDLTEGDEPGPVGYLRFVDEPDGKGIRCALFLTTVRGEPVDFCFTRIDVHNSFLWRQGDARRHAVTSLIKALFQAANSIPVLILGLSDEIPPRVFADDIQSQVPLGRFSTAEVTVQAASETLEPMTGSLSLTWSTEQPGQGSDARKLLEAIVLRQDPLEPFERAAAGIAEAFDGR